MKSTQSPFGLITNNAAETAVYEIKSRMMVVIRDLIESNNWSQKEAAAKLAVTQPRVSNLVNGKIDKFSLDMLTGMLAALGVEFNFSLPTGQSCQNG